MWQKPAFQELLSCLQQLRVEPPVWNLKISRAEILREQDTTVQHRREIASYLSSVISSNLGWIEDEDQREQLWTEASKRLSERCGRAGRRRRAALVSAISRSSIFSFFSFCFIY